MRSQREGEENTYSHTLESFNGVAMYMKVLFLTDDTVCMWKVLDR